MADEEQLSHTANNVEQRSHVDKKEEELPLIDKHYIMEIDNNNKI